MRHAADGRTYFVDHVLKKTSWHMPVRAAEAPAEVPRPLPLSSAPATSPGKATTSDVYEACRLAWKDTRRAFVLAVDGACASNGRAGARAGSGVYVTDSLDGASASVPIDPAWPQTNNVAELFALLHACTLFDRYRTTESELWVVLDSVYVRTCVANCRAWRARGWRLASGKPPANRFLLEQLATRLDGELVLHLELVKGHSNSFANNKADALAVAACV